VRFAANTPVLLRHDLKDGSGGGRCSRRFFVLPAAFSTLAAMSHQLPGDGSGRRRSRCLLPFVLTGKDRHGHGGGRHALY